MLLVLSLTIILKEGHHRNPGLEYPDRCMSCHHTLSDPGKSHSLKAFGCASCHLGNPYSLDKKRAHAGMVKNPGDLRIVERTCGKPSCHPGIVSRVKRSVMATNRGILNSIQNHWVPHEALNVSVRDLLGPSPPGNLAVDHYRKMCGGCHLWKKRGDREGEIGRRGGGCSDCHIPDSSLPVKTSEESQRHPVITIHIPSANCIKCHNRSARIGLSYMGRFESAGYGTPYEGKRLSSRRLSGRRFFLHVNADVHFRKAGMSCIDCHTGTGLMGDGKEYDFMDKQVDITCRACHRPAFRKITNPDSVAFILFSANKQVPRSQGNIGFTKKGTPVYNLQLQGGKPIFFRKRDGRPLTLDTDSGKKPYHMLPGHERLSCQSCHSPWMPQCYGCHITYKSNETQRDWLPEKMSKGRWMEARSYIRFLKPALGLRNGSMVYPISPCQVFLPHFLTKNGHSKDIPSKIFTVSAFDPHTSTLESRECRDCHGDPKTLGLGEGILWKEKGKWEYRPTYDSAASNLGISFPLDGLMSEEQKESKTNASRKTRPFIKSERDHILAVNACLGCHNRYDDKIYQNFGRSLERFRNKEDLPCKRQ